MRNQTVALGLGSNLSLGLKKPIENLRSALAEIKKSSLFEVITVSSIYESDAQLPENASLDWNKNFLNAVVLCRLVKNLNHGIGAEDLLNEVKNIELKVGRTPSERWAPRLIDIDILYWSSEDFASEKINIPHKKLTERPFALLPLLEVWPEIGLAVGSVLPDWIHTYIEQKPFNTKKSQKFFWPKIVGILNITRDSFSDGGSYLDSESLHRQYNKLIEDGADIIDIGAESTRPGAVSVADEEEYHNLNWALSEIGESSKVCKISLDCRKPGVIKRVLETHSITYLNDVTGFSDSEMKVLLKKSQLPAFVMHSLSVPPSSEASKNIDASSNPCQQLVEWWQTRLQDLTGLGIAQDQLIFDPGIGFGKSRLQNLFILRHLEQLSAIKNSVMIGHSRKSFLSLFSDRQAKLRDLETALITKELNLAYVQYLRVHDVESQILALKARAT